MFIVFGLQGEYITGVLRILVGACVFHAESSKKIKLTPGVSVTVPLIPPHMVNVLGHRLANCS
jgi:hypothetical protein